MRTAVRFVLSLPGRAWRCVLKLRVLHRLARLEAFCSTYNPCVGCGGLFDVKAVIQKEAFVEEDAAGNLYLFCKWCWSARNGKPVRFLRTARDRGRRREP